MLKERSINNYFQHIEQPHKLPNHDFVFVKATYTF